MRLRALLGWSLMALLLTLVVGLAFAGSGESDIAAGPASPQTTDVSQMDTRVDLVPSAFFSSTCRGLDCSFIDLTQHDGVIKWIWGFGDGSRGAGRQVSHTFLEDGIYEVSLTVVSEAGLTDVAQRTVTVSTNADPSTTEAPVNSEPLASFTFECRDLTCDFRDTSIDDGLVVERAWVFGDGSISQEISPTHQYRQGGSYDVGLRVTDDLGVIGDVAHTITLPIPSATTETSTSPTGVPPSTTSIGNLPQVSRIPPPVYPFGPHIGGAGGWELLDAKFTGGHINPYPHTVVDDLNGARADGKGIVLLLARTASHYKNPDGTFNLDMWKSRIDEYAHLDFTPWIDDGTFVAHYLVSEPMARGRWGGQVIPAAVLDEMARYSKQYWPTLPTAVREQPTDLIEHAGGYGVPDPGWNWQYLDISWARYSDRKGDIDEFIAEEVAAAKAQGLGLIFGMNVLGGGDGSSGRIGYGGGWVMSVDEVLTYGSKMISEPYGCAFFMWRLDTDDIAFFARPEVDAAMEELAGFARSRPPRACASP